MAWCLFAPRCYVSVKPKNNATMLDVAEKEVVMLSRLSTDGPMWVGVDGEGGSASHPSMETKSEWAVSTTTKMQEAFQ
ncbi:hypothetical protein TSMEX_008461 [Taenia solium]|eukprot:TsM_000819800 transcript=TsM_000819800 gene=TsM_000819800